MKYNIDTILPASLLGILIILIVLIMSPWSMLSVNNMHGSNNHNKTLAQEMEHHQKNIITENRNQGDYACCLEKPCTYCISKTSPKHGEGTSCSCLNDIMNGKHPCGECMGEIMEGHGNKYLSKYFANSIADEMGEQYLPVLKEMMSDKYKIAPEEQL